MKGLLCLTTMVLAMSSGCADFDGPVRSPRKRSAQPVFLRVAPIAKDGSAWALERATGNVFVTAKYFKLYGAPGEILGPHRMGALPSLGRDFVLWPAAGLPSSPRATSREIVIPAQGGPWRGLVVEMRPEHRYPAEPFFPVPAQTPSRQPVATEMLYCHLPSSDACMSWNRAVEQGYVWCETIRGRRLRRSECRWYVPDTHWWVNGLQVHPW